MHISSTAAERQKKPREDPRHENTLRGRELMRRTSPPAKWMRVIEATSSLSEEAEDYRHERSMSEREQSLRFGFVPSINYSCCMYCLDKRMHVDSSRVQ